MKFFFWKQRNNAGPVDAFTRRLKRQLLERHAALYPERPRFALVPMIRYGMALSMAVIFAFSATGVYAYENPDVNEEHPLYFMKRGIERAEEVIAARSPETVVVFHEKQIKRRLAEIERLKTKQRPAARAVREAQDNFDRVEAAQEKIVEPKKRERVKKFLEEVEKRDEFKEKREERLEKKKRQINQRKKKQDENSDGGRVESPEEKQHTADDK
ncbi:MAG: hypothetical protein HW383_50 [Candidatus Magasanikbacteria bacterium]|nr:hypothetical protein [Candidatus Magasanikbacteria bacterium]